MLCFVYPKDNQNVGTSNTLYYNSQLTTVKSKKNHKKTENHDGEGKKRARRTKIGKWGIRARSTEIGDSGIRARSTKSWKWDIENGAFVGKKAIRNLFRPDEIKKLKKNTKYAVAFFFLPSPWVCCRCVLFSLLLTFLRIRLSQQSLVQNGLIFP